MPTARRIPLFVHCLVFCAFLCVLSLAVLDPLERVVRRAVPSRRLQTVIVSESPERNKADRGEPCDGTNVTCKFPFKCRSDSTGIGVCDYFGRPPSREKLQEQLKWLVDTLDSVINGFLLVWFGDWWRISLQLVFAWQYKKRVIDIKPRVQSLEGVNPDSWNERERLHHGLFDCCGAGHTCCYVCVCGATRAADTYEIAGVLDFWCTLVLALFCSPCFLMCIMPCKRAEVRGKLGGDATCTWRDVLAVWCCGPCVSCQDAQNVDSAVHSRVRCVCTLEAVM